MPAFGGTVLGRWHAEQVRTTLTVTVAILLAACSGSADQAEPGGPGELVVTGPEGEVRLVDPETGETEELDAAAGHPGSVQPTASHDGGTIVWSAATDDGRPVVRVHTDGGRRDIEVPTLPYFYAFDAASATVAALGNDPEGAGVALLLVDLDTDEARIVEVGQPYYLDWHPNEPTLVVHVGTSDLAILDTDDGRDPLAIEPGPFQAPAWTGEGRVLAPVSSEGATAAVGELVQATIDELAVIDATDGTFQPVAAIDEMVMFEVAADRVAYVEGDTGVGPLAVVGLDGEDPVEVADDVAAFEWSPSGDLLLFHVIEADVGFVPHVWDGEEVEEYPPFVPTVTFLSEYLPFWSQYVRTITQWAPDGTAFAYAEGTDESTVWIQPRDGERRAMGPGVMVSWSP